MKPEWIAAIAAAASLLVTVAGWFVVYSKQKKLETLKGEIQKILSEHDTRFDYLHKRRGEVIDELYKRMDRITSLLQASVRTLRLNVDRSLEEQRKEAFLLIGPLMDCYYQNCIYID